MVKNDDEFALLYSSNPPNHEQISIEVTLFSSAPVLSHIYCMEGRAVTYKILQLACPQSIVLIEWMLVRHGLESGDFLFLGDDFLGCVVEDGFHCFYLVFYAGLKRKERNVH